MIKYCPLCGSQDLIKIKSKDYDDTCIADIGDTCTEFVGYCSPFKCKGCNKTTIIQTQSL